VDLQSEYRLAAAFFEKRLRLLVYLAREGSPKSKLWGDWKKEGLNNLLQIANGDPYLKGIVGGIDREVRNALAHGAPRIDMVTGSCEFEDLGRRTRWTFQPVHVTTAVNPKVECRVGLDNLQRLSEDTARLGPFSGRQDARVGGLINTAAARNIYPTSIDQQRAFTVKLTCRRIPD
jgi:hypothetical protein